MNLYAGPRRWGLFVLLAPCVLATDAVLLAWSLLGLLLFVPGVLGLAGLAGLLLGWTGLAAPGFVRRHRVLVGALLVAGLCAAVLGMILGWSAHSASGHDLAYLVGLGGTSLGYAAIAGFFLAGVARAHEDARAPARGTLALAAVLALATALLPVGVLLFVSGLPKVLRQMQGEEGMRMAREAQQAVMRYALAHGVAPKDNASAGLPEPDAGRYVRNLRIADGRIEVAFGAEMVSSLFLASAEGAGFTLEPPAGTPASWRWQTVPAQESDRAAAEPTTHWRCKAHVAALDHAPIYPRGWCN